MIAIEIDDINLSRVIPTGSSEQWTFDEATLTQTPYGDTDGLVSLKTTSVEYEQYYKDADGYGMAAHAILLNPKEGQLMSMPDPETDTLVISYTYRRLRQAPQGADILASGQTASQIASSIPVVISLIGNTFSIENVSKSTVYA